MLTTVDHINRFLLPALAQEYVALKDKAYEAMSEDEKGKMSHIITAIKNWAVRSPTPLDAVPHTTLHAHAGLLPRIDHARTRARRRLCASARAACQCLRNCDRTLRCVCALLWRSPSWPSTTSPRARRSPRWRRRSRAASSTRSCSRAQTWAGTGTPTRVGLPPWQAAWQAGWPCTRQERGHDGIHQALQARPCDLLVGVRHEKHVSAMIARTYGRKAVAAGDSVLHAMPCVQ